MMKIMEIKNINRGADTTRIDDVFPERKRIGNYSPKTPQNLGMVNSRNSFLIDTRQLDNIPKTKENCFYGERKRSLPVGNRK